MSQTAKTIQIFLPQGDPRGIRVAEITTRIVQVFDVPRSLLPDFIAMQESKQVAIYILVGEDEDEVGSVYIGQTGNLTSRLANHHKKKDFWERALVVVSRTNSLTQTHALFLEWYCLQATREAARYADENGNSGSQPHTPAPLKADCLEIFHTAKILLATLGYPLFDAVAQVGSRSEDDEVLYCTAAGTNGRGLYTSEGFVVLKDSIGRKANVASIKGKASERRREKIFKSGVVRIDGDTIVFEKDQLFGSPSTAGLALLGRTCNGWKTWKNKAGKTLNEIERQ